MKDQGISKSVLSNQVCHPEKVQLLVKKHAASRYQKPIRPHNVVAYKELITFVGSNVSKPLILDSGCGTGMSANLLARENPGHLVIAIDQSISRLSKFQENMPTNLILLRANCEDIWRLLQEADFRFERHYLLYPNPWPKAAHLKRRWHGHPVFPVLPKLAATTIVRSNWQTYLDEWNLAWQTLVGHQGEVKKLNIHSPLTLFEKKYSHSGHKLYELRLG